MKITKLNNENKCYMQKYKFACIKLFCGMHEEAKDWHEFRIYMSTADLWTA